MKGEQVFLEKLLQKQEQVDYQRVISAIASRWQRLVIAIGLAGLLAWIFIRIVRPSYRSEVALQYPDRQSALDNLEGSYPALALWQGPGDCLIEKYVIESPDVLEHALKGMNMPFTFRCVRNWRKTDIYPFRPLGISILSYDRKRYENGVFRMESPGILHYRARSGKRRFSLKAASVVSVPGLSFRIDTLYTAPGFHCEFMHNDLQQLAYRHKKRIRVVQAEEQMPILRLSFEHHNKAYTRDFMRSLIAAYRAGSLRQKQRAYDLTLGFIRKQLNVYSDSLQDAAESMEAFKRTNELADITTSVNEISRRLHDLEASRDRVMLRLQELDLMKRRLDSLAGRQADDLPAGMDILSEILPSALRDRIAAVVSGREALSITFAPNAPLMKNVGEEEALLRQRIAGHLAFQRQKAAEELLFIQGALTESRSRLQRIPDLEKSLRDLQSELESNRGVQALLLQKETESAVARAGILPAFQTITYLELRKVFPKPLQVFTLFVLAGLCAGVGTLFLTRRFQKKFSDISALAGEEEVTLAGIIPRFPQKLAGRPGDLLVLQRDKGAFTEALNVLRAKLVGPAEGAPATRKEGGELLCIVSEQAGEGKSLLAVSLALSFTKIGKTVLIIGADLRRSRLHLYFGDDEPDGLSEWLQEYNGTDPGPVRTTAFAGLYYIPAGKPPHNPAELLHTPAFRELLETVRPLYDYVILDTAPLGLVADNLPFLHLCDRILFVIRWLYSGRDTPEAIKLLAKEYRTPVFYLLVNDFYPDPLYARLLTGPAYGTEYNGFQTSGKYERYGDSGP